MYRANTHFDLANNYGPVYGSAEMNMGKILKLDLMPYRKEMVISTKAGYDMWKGPYGDGGSRKYLISSLDESLKRLGLEYVDIFYHHRPDNDTPMEETMQALDQIVRSGKDFLYHNGIGCIAFSPLAQGILTGKYIKGIPADSRAGSGKSPYLHREDISKEKLETVGALQEIAVERGQTLTQMALAWILRDEKVTSVLIGASRPEQIKENIKCLQNTHFSQEECDRIDEILMK